MIYTAIFSFDVHRITQLPNKEIIGKPECCKDQICLGIWELNSWICPSNSVTIRFEIHARHMGFRMLLEQQKFWWMGLDIVLCQRLELTQAIMRLTLGNHALDFCNAILRKSVVQEGPKLSSWKVLKK